mmetsp:Transcript_58007/g.149304  ORF Transcript_58007/g.149304 Transcript_58007/m.149304 type:complete len:301 (+) Transcript_58007:208-1110(+)
MASSFFASHFASCAWTSANSSERPAPFSLALASSASEFWMAAFASASSFTRSALASCSARFRALSFASATLFFWAISSSARLVRSDFDSLRTAVMPSMTFLRFWVSRRTSLISVSRAAWMFVFSRTEASVACLRPCASFSKQSDLNTSGAIFAPLVSDASLSIRTRALSNSSSASFICRAAEWSSATARCVCSWSDSAASCSCFSHSVPSIAAGTLAPCFRRHRAMASCLASKASASAVRPERSSSSSSTRYSTSRSAASTRPATAARCSGERFRLSTTCMTAPWPRSTDTTLVWPREAA